MSTTINTGRPPRILGVFAHPDDESFCAGGTLAKYAAAGAEIMIVSATRGDALRAYASGGVVAGAWGDGSHHPQL